MVQDRGGLAYRIVVEDVFSATTAKFVGEITAAKEAWKSFKAEISATRGEARGLRDSLRETTGATKEASQANKENAQASKQAAAEARAAAKAVADEQKKATADAKAAAKAKREAAAAARADAKATADAERKAAAEARAAAKAAIADARAAARAKREAAAETRAAAKATADIERKAAAEARAAAKEQAAAKRQAAAEARAAAAETKAAARAEAAARRAAAAESKALARAEADLKRAAAAEAKAALRAEAAARKTAAAEARAAAKAEAEIKRAAVAEARAAAKAEIAIKRAAAAEAKVALREEAAARRANAAAAKAAAREAEAAARKATAEQKALNKELTQSEGLGNRIAFTFRRLFGILAAFTAVRAVVQGFQDMVLAAIRFNAQIEQSVLGVATLLTAVGSVRDATGATVAPALALAKAQQIAKKQVELLRLEALQTAATFEDLAETFQVALAPGLQAGLDVDRVRKFSVEISKAAATIGLAQNQLSEEIRSILAGTIQQRTTRIAVALGITNEDIRNAKELGVLTQFLEQRFKAFNAAGKESEKLFAVIASNLKDALLQLAGAGSFEFFVELKGLFTDIQASIVEINAENIRINPEAQQVVSALFSGLTEAVKQARKFREEMDLRDALPIARAIGASFAIAADIAFFFLKAVIDGIQLLEKVGAKASAVFESFRGSLQNTIPVDDIKELLANVTKIGVVVGGIALSLKAVGFLAAVAVAPFKLLLGSTKLLLSTLLQVGKAVRAIGFASLLNPAGLLTVAVLATVAGAVLLIKKLESVGLRFETIVTIVKDQLVGAIEAAAAVLNASFQVAISSIRGAFNLFVLAFEKSLSAAIQLVADLGDTVGIDTSGLAKRAADFASNAEKTTADIKKNAKDAADAVQAADAQLAKISDRVAAGLFKALEDNKDAQTLDQFVAGIGASLKQTLSGIFSDVDLGLGTLVEQVEPLSKVFSDLPGIVGKSNTQLDETSRIVQELKNDLQDAGDAFLAATQTANLSGSVQKQSLALLEGQAQIRKQLVELATAEKDAEERLRAAKALSLGAQQRLTNLAEEARAKVTEGVLAGERQLALESQIATNRSQQILQQEVLNKAIKDGNQATIDATTKEVETLKAVGAQTEILLQQQKDLVDQILAGVDPEVAKQITEIIQQSITAKGEEKVVTEELLGLAEQRKNVEDQIRKAIELRIGAAARQEIPALQNQLALQQVQLQNARDLAKFQETALRPGGGVQSDIAQAEAGVRERETILLLTQKQAQADEKARRAVLAQTTNQEARIALEQEMALEAQKTTGEIQAQTLALEIERRKLQDLRLLMGQPVQSGIAIGLENVKKQADAATATARIVENTVADVANNVSGLLVDALFSEDDAKSAKERILDFFKALIAQIIAAIVVAIILNILLGGEAGVAGGLVGGALGVARAKGGKVKGPGKVPAGEGHARPGVQGMRRGGRVQPRNAQTPPKGVDRRDRIPVWSRVGEWFITPEAVKTYGDRFMRAVNEMRIDPMAAQSLIEGVPLSTVVREPPKVSFAEGGRVRETTTPEPKSSVPARRVFQGERQGDSNQRVVSAVVVNDDQNLDRQLSGGRGAAMRFFETHAKRINAALASGSK